MREHDSISNVCRRLLGGDCDAALSELVASWPTGDLLALLHSHDLQVLRLALRAIGLTGGVAQSAALVALLGHADPSVSNAAEDALWHIWMRAGTRCGNERLAEAIGFIRDERYEAAIERLLALEAAEPDFAEVRHQLAIALHSLDRLEPAEAAYAAALRVNPYHFAAAAGLGHVCAQRGDLRGALRHYRRALHIHPRLAGIREIVPRIDAALERRVVA